MRSLDRLARKLIGGDGAVEKEYTVTVRSLKASSGAVVSKEKLELLRHGLALDGHVLRPAIVNLLPTREHWRRHDQDDAQLQIVLREGRYRQSAHCYLDTASATRVFNPV